MDFGHMTFFSSRTAIAIALSAGLLPAAAEEAPTEAEITEEVWVISRRGSDFSVITEQAQYLVDMPGALGDPLLAVFSLPGVLFGAGEGGAPAVRGSSPADNLYQVDGMPAGYIFHPFSNSIFNENILQGFDLYSAGFGPEFGNATGAVFDITLRQPRNQPFSTTLDLSMLRAGAFIEGAVTERSEFYLSARASLMHLFIDLVADDIEDEEGIRIQSAPRDTDYQFKYAWRPGQDSTLTLSANGATSLAAAEFTENATGVQISPDLRGDARIDHSFHNQSLRWSRLLVNAAELDLRLGHYRDDLDSFWGDGYFANIRLDSNILRADYTLPVRSNHTLSMGGELRNNQHQYDFRVVNYACTEFDPDCFLRRGDVVASTETLEVTFLQTHLNHHWAISNAWELDLGLQRQNNDYTNESFWHPRTALAWHFAPDWTASAAAGTYNRFPEVQTLLPSLGGNPELNSPTATHFTLGLNRELPQRWSWQLEVYYKWLDNLPLSMEQEDAEQDQPLYTPEVSGRAYGVDALINKELTERWYGWASLSYARSTRTNERTGDSNNYPLDTPMVFNLVSGYQINPLWHFGLRFTARTGQANTPIIGVQENPWFADSYLPIYGDPFSERLPTYHRLDLRLKRDITLFRHAGHFTIDLINALNTRNVLGRNLDYDRVDSTEELFTEDDVSLGLFPSLGLSVTF